ncbi:MAG: DUF2017 domain-containing protein [Actinocatenispora sp.]
MGSFPSEYATVLRELISQTSSLLSGPVDRSDPGLARLFPDAYSDSDADSAEFRHYTEDDLRTGKVETAQLVLDTLPADGGQVRLDAEQSSAWLRALNDVRLLLGSRLDIADDTDLSGELSGELARDESSPRVAQLAAYGYLSELQESLVEALVGW